jgi:hypothetical protein
MSLTSKFRSFCQWFFQPLPDHATIDDIWKWWAARRLPYNVIVALTAAVSYGAFELFCTSSGLLAPGEDAEEPMGLMAGIVLGPIAWNICYYLGPLTDESLRSFKRQPRGPLFLKLGIAFSVILLCIPSGCWAILWTREMLKYLAH